MILHLKLSKILISVIVVSGLFGLLSPYDYNILPATLIFEILFLVTCIVLSRELKDKISILISALAFFYIFVKYILTYFFYEAFYLDFIQAYKAFVYLSLMFAIAKSNFICYKDFEKLILVLVSLMLLKYSYSVAIKFDDLQGERPGIFTENNFELMILVIFHSALYRFNKNLFFKLIPIIIFIILLSSSRSGMLAFVVSISILLFPERKEQYPIFFFIIFILFSLMLIVFNSRMTDDGFDSIDRLKLLNYFLYEIRGWSFFNFIFGSEPLKDLSYYTCSSLPFYEKLFSLSGQPKCYSVILHSYILRAIFDHGLLGLLFLVFSVYHFLRQSGYSLKITVSVLLSIFANATSVSSFNSVYVMLPIVIICGLRILINEDN